jgi:hypothetical protein
LPHNGAFKTAAVVNKTNTKNGKQLYSIFHHRRFPAELIPAILDYMTSLMI